MIGVVHGLASGSYETYKLHCVFMDEADAEAAVAAGAGEYVEPLPLLGPGAAPYQVTLWRAYAAGGEGGHSCRRCATDRALVSA